MRFFSLRWLRFNWLVTCGLLFSLSKKSANSAWRICPRQGVITVHKSPLVSCLHYLCLTLVCVTDAICFSHKGRMESCQGPPVKLHIRSVTLGQENDIAGSTDQKKLLGKSKSNTNPHNTNGLLLFCVLSIYYMYVHIHIYCMCMCMECVYACSHVWVHVHVHVQVHFICVKALVFMETRVCCLITLCLTY